MAAAIASARRRRRRRAPHGGEHRHAARLLERDEHVRGAVLQRLEGADGDAELLAGLQVFDGGLERFVHRADRLGAQRRVASSATRSTSGSAVLGIAEHGVGADLDIRRT